MNQFTIIHDRKDCIGCTACELAAPENWVMEEEDCGLKSKPKKTKIGEAEFPINLEAAQICPVNVIHIHDSKNKKLI